ncbi:MAG: hypothetical protein AAFQ98_10130 [Bacteroidota bacterium]
MSTKASEAAAFALQDILVGLAEGLNEAQEALQDQDPYDALGRPNTRYQLPYLDFTLKVTSEFESQTQSTSSGSTGGAYTAPYYRRMLFRPAATTRKSQSSSQEVEIISTLSGRFVANNPTEGRPQTILQVKVKEFSITSTQAKIDLETLVSNAAGEALDGVLVEYNLDEEMMDRLNTRELKKYVDFTVREDRTDAQGVSKVRITFPGHEWHDKAFSFVVKVNAGPISKSLTLGAH